MAKRMSYSCCGEPMVCLGLMDFLNPMVDSVRRWVCPTCGHAVDLVHFNLDGMELRQLLELYGDRVSPVSTQELKGGEG